MSNEGAKTVLRNEIKVAEEKLVETKAYGKNSIGYKVAKKKLNTLKKLLEKIEATETDPEFKTT